MTRDLEPNFEPLTPEALARQMIERYGDDDAGFQAAMNSDHFYEHNQNHIAKIWHDASKIIEALRLIRIAVGGSDGISFSSGSAGS